MANIDPIDEIVFLDIEITGNNIIKEIGVVHKEYILKTSSASKVRNFLKESKSKFVCGHNFLKFDVKMLQETRLYQALKTQFIIDTLPLSLLFFNEKTLHKLPKNYKTEDNFRNDPIKDSLITKELLEKIRDRYITLDKDLQNIFYSLLKDKNLFKGFFLFIKQTTRLEKLDDAKLKESILKIYKKALVNQDNLTDIIHKNPIELSYILALLYPDIEMKSHPPKILYDFPNILKVQEELCFNFEIYKNSIGNFSKEIFGFGSFREFPKLNPSLMGKNSISQKDIILSSLKDESFLAVLPTGGGKTFTFWLPAVLKAKSFKSLTVVISPLQALIEDHIKSFNKKVANYKAVAISGFMSPLERAEAVEQVINGEADILYISPESLRSNMIFNVLKNRVIERFVIDEVHCLSTWGNDFRQDYYYICDYINDLRDAKPIKKDIPVSCFTATAKPSVIKDIKEYFYQGLDIKLNEFIAIPERKNLKYKSIPMDAKDKYLELLKLINDHSGSTLVYIPSSTKTCDKVAEKLNMDTDKIVKSFHSKIDSQTKMQILNDYITDKIDVIVATTAFGMGVDKANITNVIHYEISDSLENYAQEAGRGARDLSSKAFCPILYNESDLDKHFATLNRAKLNTNDINSIFRVLKKHKNDMVYKSIFELAKEAGWDVEDDSSDYKTKVKTALLELEREGYIKRKRNRVHFYADSIAKNSMEKLHNYLDSSNLNEEEKNRLTLVYQTIIGQSKNNSIQIDEIAYLLGYEKHKISETIQKLKEIDILGNNKDLSLQIKPSSLKKFLTIKDIENKIFIFLKNLKESMVSIKSINEELSEEYNYSEVIKEIVKGWRSKGDFIFKRVNRQKDIWYFEIIKLENLENSIKTRHNIAKQVLEIFISQIDKKKQNAQKIEFSLKDISEKLDKKYNLKDIDKTLLYLHYLKILELLNGRFINYSPLVIEKTDKFDYKRKYTKEEYKKRLQKHYSTKIESIHIIGEFAKRLNENKKEALTFMKDYFTIPYEKFKRKYKLLKKQLSRPITQSRYKKIFSSLSDEQKRIIEDKDSKSMMILAGPGSGKTKVLVHKIASLILTEDIKPEQFMMLTFSRSAVREFKSRLNTLIGTLSYDIEINTFHAFCLNIIAREVMQNEDILKSAIQNATKQILNEDITLPLKSVLVLDEYQDINEDSFELIKAIYEKNDKELKIIAVGDDDQCINTHAGADVAFIDKFKKEFGTDDEGNNVFKKYELLTNYRSYQNIVKYSNDFISKLSKRYKKQPLIAHSDKNGKVQVISCKTKKLTSAAIDIITKENDFQDMAVLAYTNDEVLDIYSKLQERNIPAKYIIDRNKFELKNIIEIVEFDALLNSYLNTNVYFKEDDFERAYEQIAEIYKDSKNLQLLRKVIDSFLEQYENYYVSQWISYLDEAKIEVFENDNKLITVSTIHKSKGLEFNNVYMLIKNKPKDNNDIRLYYVGMTRAKRSLTVIRHGDNNFKHKSSAQYIYHDKEYDNRAKIRVFVMGLSDIYLGYNYQNYYKDLKLIAGEKVKIDYDKYDRLGIYHKNRLIGVFSKAFREKLNYQGENYICTIDYIVSRYDKKANKITYYPLCKITLFYDKQI